MLLAGRCREEGFSVGWLRVRPIPTREAIGARLLSIRSEF